MQTPRVTRSSVLGKRTHQQDPSIAVPTKSCDVQLPTPDSTPTPKRARTSIGYYYDGDSNKENVPPVNIEATSLDTSPSLRGTRAVRRTATELPSPSRPRPIRRHVSTTSVILTTPNHGTSHLSLTTPPATPKLLLPLHARVKALLRTTCNDTNVTITCRDAERDVITNFIQSFVNGEVMRKCLYISGSPGTGKTALLNSVLQTLDSNVCSVISINCMTLKGVEVLWQKLFDDLVSADAKLGKMPRLQKLKGREAVEAALAALSIKCILVLDELDFIASDSRALDGILALPNINPEFFRLIGIANTHTLLSGASAVTCQATRDVLTTHFAPYNAIQLQEILQSRLGILNNDDQGSSDSGMTSFLPLPSLTLLAKKTAAMTGDVRSLFEVLRGAIDIAVSSSISSEDPLAHSPKVTPNFILQALKSHTPFSNHATKVTSLNEPVACNSEIVAKINGLNLQARVILLCILLGSKRLESSLPVLSGSISPRKAAPLKRSSSATTTCSRQMYIDTTQLHSYYSATLLRCDATCLNVVSKSELKDLLVILEGAGLIASSHVVSSITSRQGKKMLSRSTSFSSGLRKTLATGEIRLAEGVWENEVLRGLGIANIVDGDVLQCEIRGIWEREMIRLGREKNQHESTNLN